MALPSVIKQSDRLLYPDVLFNRPINPILKPRVLLVGGSPGQLKDFSDAYKTIVALGMIPSLIVPHKTSLLGADLKPDGLIETTKNGQLDKAQLDQVVGDNHLILLAPGLAETSTNQLAVEYMLNVSKAMAVLTDEVVRLAQIEPKTLQRPNTIFCLSTGGLMALANYLQVAVTIRPQRGIFNKYDIIQAVQEQTNGVFVVYDQNQIIVVETADKIGVIDLESAEIPALRGMLIGLVTGLSANTSTVLDNAFEKIMTAGFIFRQVNQSQDIFSSIKKVAERDI